ncbi:MAG: DUF4115 domain-containing protein [Sterolibacterium sp.]|nr:DUF4115 domain-containing protein [Sterolibacterium sp.]
MNDLLDSANAAEPESPDGTGGFVQTTVSESVPLAATLGQSLQAARQARGLSIDDVARVIKFGARQIAAVERDDFSKLPGTTVVRGFIRSYAKLLQVDSATLLALYDQQVPAFLAATTVLPDETAPLPQFGGRDHPLRRFWLPVCGIVILLAAIAAYFFWQPLPLSIPSMAVDSAAEPLAEVQPSEAASVANEKAVDATPAVVAATTAASSPAEAAEAPFTPGTVLQDVSPVMDMQESHQLVFDFDATAWVEVKDATTKVIFAQNNPPGTRQVVSGQPPFAVVVGNASRVRLRYGDRPVDLQPYTKVDVARLNLE